MKSAYLLAGVQFRMLFRMIRRYGLSLHPRYFFRFLFLLQNSVWASFFAWKDKIHFGKKTKAHPVPSNPVFIIGHWRTGSTYLHQLMSLDQRLSAPSLFQTAQPNGYMSAYRYFRPVMNLFLGKTRPFDNVKSGIDEPQEDEFALVRMCGFSPLLGLVFPDSQKFFLGTGAGFLPEGGGETEKWREALQEFVRKLSWSSGRRVLLKNPFHSFRIPELYRMFPDAKFIHICRNPLDVVPSAARMWSVVGRQNSLKPGWKNPDFEDVSGLLNRLLTKVEEDAALLPRGSFYQLRYEDLVSNPVGSLQNVYRALGLEFDECLKENILKFTRSNAEFKKGSYRLSEKEKEMITARLLPHMYRLEYLPHE